MKFVEGVILDFDGTLAPGVPEVAIAVLHETVNQWRPVPLAFVRQFYRASSAFRMDRALELFLEALGLSRHVTDVAQALGTAKGHGPWDTSLDPWALSFLKARSSVHIFSSGGNRATRFAEVAALLGVEAFLDYRDAAKSDPATWERITADRGWQPDRRVVVDDSPLALWAAKTAGYTTVMRRNTVFTEADEQEYRPWIDHSVDSLEDLAQRFRRILPAP